MAKGRAGATAGLELLSPLIWQGWAQPNAQDEFWVLGQKSGKRRTVLRLVDRAGCVQPDCAETYLSVHATVQPRGQGQMLHVTMQCMLPLTCGCAQTVLEAVCVYMEHAVCEPETRRCSSTSACPLWLLGEKAPLQPALLPSLKSFVLSPLLILLALLGDVLVEQGNWL